MARPTTDTLKPTKSALYWPSRAKPGPKGERFEKVADCQGEDRLRVKSSRKLGCRTREKRQRKAILRLTRKLDYDARDKRGRKSLACSLHMRRKRDAIFSQVWRLADRFEGPVTTATVIKRGWEYTPDQLHNVDPDKLQKGFLADLDRRGAVRARGWLIGFVHGEWETPTDVFRLHLHLIMAGGMITVVDKLRDGRNYKYREGDSVYCRVRIDRKQLTNLPYPFTYCFKSYWPWKHVTMTANGKRRTRKHKRIPEPYHTQVLLFLDKHGLNDLVVLKHVSVRRGRLVHYKQRRGER